MILSSIAGLIAFAFLVVPGATWGYLRNQHRAPVKESALIEFSKIAFYSVVFLAVSSIVYGWLWADFFNDLPRDGHLDKYSWLQLAILTVGHVLFATGICLIASRYCFKGPQKIPAYNTLEWIFQRKRPPDTSPTIHIELANGSAAIGNIHYYDVAPDTTEKFLALNAPYLLRETRGSEWVKKEAGYFLVPLSKIESWEVEYSPIT